jgi:hypothetical protein
LYHIGFKDGCVFSRVYCHKVVLKGDLHSIRVVVIILPCVNPSILLGVL